MLYAASFNEEETGGGRTLGEFVSSCCPRLLKLFVCAPMGLSRLVLRAKELEELHLVSARDLRTLDATVPNLRLLKLLCCFQDSLVPGSGSNVVSKVARIASLRLEDVQMNHFLHCRRPDLDIYDLTSVRRLGDLRLDVHGRYCRIMDAGLWLLENCPNVEHVDVQLGHSDANSGDFVDLTSEGAKPFDHRKRLKRSWKCFCDDLNISRSHEENLEYLGEVKISGFTGAEEDMDLVTMLFESSNSIKSMT
ncbi:hypothetical protein BAE44_0011717 [Dichanthelium oligosanthes]|uniref:FBD domain-containing protein n=1 Tax=Dichanthelium oligosanthes TaxID=888268 RepID=A0A1E5VQB3_9POAL|nr:hypothetical protein BAE44_0011717 [Dichanthelium oligosanthes]